LLELVNWVHHGKTVASYTQNLEINENYSYMNYENICYK